MAEQFEVNLSEPRKPDCVKFNIQSIDDIFAPEEGIPAQGITEFYGASGAGKTQICLHLVLSILCQKEDNKVVYICTEGVFPMKRFCQMLESKCLKGSTHRLKDNLLLRHETTLDTLMQCVTRKLV